MMKSGKYRKAFSSVIFWSIISAAFIGPGTITTALTAGSSYKYQLLWALCFSLIACFFIQEASARITIVTGKTLGESIQSKFNASGRWLKSLAGFSIVFGCMAYQAGNLAGAIAGFGLLIPFNQQVILTAFVIIIMLLLLIDNLRLITRLMGSLVGIMGLVFIGLAFSQEIEITNILQYGLIPNLPAGSELLVVSLVGTTIVPYNIFLGSGISHLQSKKAMRIGLGGAILIGGIISIAVLLVGSSLQGDQSFAAYYQSLATINPWIAGFFATGLFAAGFTSSITAPLASVITIRSIYGNKRNPKNYKWIGMMVVLTGYMAAMSGYQPIAMIITAQAINGFLLPLVTIFLLFIISDPGENQQMKSSRANVAIMYSITGIIIFLGINQVISAFLKVQPSELVASYRYWIAFLIVAIIMAGLFYWLILKRRNQSRSNDIISNTK